MGRWVWAVSILALVGCGSDPESALADDGSQGTLMQAPSAAPVTQAFGRAFDPRSVFPSPQELPDFDEHYWRVGDAQASLIAYRPTTKLRIAISLDHSEFEVRPLSGPRRSARGFGLPTTVDLRVAEPSEDRFEGVPIAMGAIDGLWIRAYWHSMEPLQEQEIERALRLVASVARRLIAAGVVPDALASVRQEDVNFVEAFDLDVAGPYESGAGRLYSDARWIPMRPSAVDFLEAGCEPVARAEMSGFPLRSTAWDVPCGDDLGPFDADRDGAIRWSHNPRLPASQERFVIAGAPDGSFAALSLLDPVEPDLGPEWTDDDRGLDVPGFNVRSRISAGERSEVIEWVLWREWNAAAFGIQMVMVPGSSQRGLLDEAMRERIRQIVGPYSADEPQS